MPGNDTHGLVGEALTASLLVALSVPVVWCVPALAGAALGSPLPDKLERPMRAVWRYSRDRPQLARFEARLRQLQRHRWWTHWMITALVVAIVAGVAVMPAAFLAAWAVLLVVNGLISGPDIAVPTAEILQYAPWAGLFSAFGLLVGCVAHTFLDRFTEWGSPWWGPWRTERLKVRKRYRITKKGEKRLRQASVATMTLLVTLQLMGLADVTIGDVATFISEAWAPAR